MVAHAFNPSTGEQRQTDLCEFKDSLVYRVIPGQRYTENLSQKVKVKIKEIEVKIKMENIQRILILYAIMLSLNCLNAEEGVTAVKRYLFINAAELIQDRYFENTLTSEFGSKDMILWKGGSSFVFTEDETLWITSIPIWYDRPRPPERFL